MKFRIPLLACLLTCVLIGWGPLASVARAAAPVTGHYTVAGTQGAYIDLRPDGSFTFHLPEIAFSGTYTAKGTEVTITVAGQKPEVIHVENGVLTDTDGNKWTRSGDAGGAQPAAGATPPVPPPAEPAVTASGNTKFTLTVNSNGKGRTGAIFPPKQMPADRKGYFWVTERPDNKTSVGPLQRNNWFVNTEPGLYKVHVEYRGSGANQTVSNVLEITIPKS